MRKSLLVLSFSLAACVAAAALVATASAQAPAPAADNPVLLAQNAPPAPNTAGPGRRGPAARGLIANGQGRPAPTAADRTARRAQMCQDQVARTAGRFAELEVRLNLTAAQTGAFTRWRDLRLAAARTRATECASRPLPAPGAARGGRGANVTPPNPVERLTREETMLQHRLADIQAERPALEALYSGLSAAQRQTLARERGGMGRGRGFGGPRGGFGPRGGMGGNMMFRRGPQGQGMMDPGIIQGPGMRGPGGPGRAGNPPPPAQ